MGNFQNSKYFWCKSCVVMSTRPRITFNKSGICSACQWMEEKKKLDWSIREKKLERLLNDQRSNSDFDCCWNWELCQQFTGLSQWKLIRPYEINLK